MKLMKTVKRRSYLVLEKNHHRAKWFSDNLLAIEMSKTKVPMNKPVNLSLSILSISKTSMYQYCCDYVKPKIKTMQNYATQTRTASYYT